MRAKAATVAVMALALIQMFAGSLLAKPTRTLPRPSARKLIASQPASRPTREHSAHAAGPTRLGSNERTAHTSASSRSRRDADLAAGREPERERNLRSSTRYHPRRRTAAEERAQAAQAAIEAADRRFHHDARPEYGSDVRAARRRGDELQADTGAEASVATVHEALRGRPVSGDERDEAASDQPVALTNVDGALRPAPGTMPLKSVEEEASTPVLLPPLRVSSLYDNRGHLIVPPPLYGSREILLHQNEMAERDGLDRVRDDADLLDLRQQKKLVPLPESEALRVDYRLPENRRFSRPWTAAFLTVLAADYYASFHVPLQVDSAVRTVEVQERLMRTNGNAAPSTGDTASPHLTGQAVDIAKGGLTRTEIAWMRTYLQPLIDVGKIDVEEEFQQSCFHISVYKSFLPIAPTHLSVAAARQPVTVSPEGPTE